MEAAVPVQTRAGQAWGAVADSQCSAAGSPGVAGGQEVDDGVGGGGTDAAMAGTVLGAGGGEGEGGGWVQEVAAGKGGPAEETVGGSGRGAECSACSGAERADVAARQRPALWLRAGQSLGSVSPLPLASNHRLANSIARAATLDIPLLPRSVYTTAPARASYTWAAMPIYQLFDCIHHAMHSSSPHCRRRYLNTAMPIEPASTRESSHH